VINVSRSFTIVSIHNRVRIHQENSELAVTSNNAAVHAYEHALNGLFERLDAMESDGNEEVRDVRREVVREVERALEEVEQKTKEQVAQGSSSSR
jgi:hypothetical protein